MTEALQSGTVAGRIGAAAPPPLTTVAQYRCFGGTQGVYRHDAAETGCPMRFAVFMPRARAA